MPNRYKPTEIENARRLIEWEGGSDFKSQLEYMAKICGWDVIALYAQDRAERQAIAKAQAKFSPELRDKSAAPLKQE